MKLPENVSESVRRRNPHLYNGPKQQQPAEIVVNESKTESRLNKTERRFLELLRGRGYRYIGVQDITLRLAWDTRYTPDFSTVDDDGVFVLWEVKGTFCRDDALVKLKTAATMFPHFIFVRAVWEDGRWTETIVPR